MSDCLKLFVQVLLVQLRESIIIQYLGSYFTLFFDNDGPGQRLKKIFTRFNLFDKPLPS